SFRCRMHKIKAAQRRFDGKERGTKGVVKKKEGGQERGGVISARFGEMMAIPIGWMCSSRCVGSICFVFGMFGRLFHIFDSFIKDDPGSASSFPSYLACPGIVFFSTVSYLLIIGLDNAQSLPQVLTMVCCSGVLAGAIIEEQLAEVTGKIMTNEDFVFLSLSCVSLSLLIHVLNYRWDGLMKDVMVRLFCVIIPAWAIIFCFCKSIGLSSLPLQLLLFTCFTLAVSIIDFFVTDLRTRVTIFNSVFPVQYVGCLVQCFAMVALTTYFTSWRSNLFSNSWFSFAWMVFAGPPVSVFMLVCHLIRWTSEQIFGPGPHNTLFVIRAVLFSWAVAAIAHHFGFIGSGIWALPVNGAKTYKSEYGW
ncbi:hypothetical protein PENTCL1PPCAC_22318, partial [Pristionchus entomophagus]